MAAPDVPSAMSPREFEELLTRLDALIAEFEGRQDPAVSARVLDLIRQIDAVHRAGLERLVALVGRRHPELLDEVAADPVLRLFLTLYDLMPGGERNVAFVPLAQLEASASAARLRRETAEPPADGPAARCP